MKFSSNTIALLDKDIMSQLPADAFCSTSGTSVGRGIQHTTYTCRLCDRGPLSKDHFQLHCSETSHTEKLAEVTKDVRFIQAFVKRLHQLSQTPLGAIDTTSMCPTWRNAIRAEALQFLMSPHEEEASDHSCIYRRYNQPVPVPRHQLREMTRYMFLEQLALLALAVWKAQCLMQMPDGGGFLVSEQWVKSGWKAQKDQHKDSDAMAIVASAVRPFLDPPLQYSVIL
jgi:hypothetical protein